MRLLLFALVAAFSPAQELGYTDTPMLPGLPYHVHDPARPHPPVVTPGPVPSDAIVLFDGKDLSKWTFSKSPWKVEDGYFEVVPKAGSISTKDKFGDIQLHIEWATPKVVQGSSQNRGNSGVFLQSRYEIQVLDSFDNPTYADGQAGAIYGQWPPLVNASKKPGEWQTYDIIFEAPKLEGEKVLKPAYATVLHNGILVQNHREIMGLTHHKTLPKYAAQPAEDSLMLQDHNVPVRYRNIWVRRLN